MTFDHDILRMILCRSGKVSDILYLSK